MQDFQRAVRSSDFTLAAELATKLDESVQQQYRASLVRAAREGIAQVLNWLPADIETFFVMQDQTTIDTNILATLSQHADRARGFAIEPLMEACEGQFCKTLDGKTLRFAAAGMR